MLREGRLSEADIEHIAEEIESMGKSEKRELVRRFTVLLLHLLKWRHQPAFRSTSWRLTLEEQRNQLKDHLADNPSLKSSFGETIAAAYRDAVLGAARETGYGPKHVSRRLPLVLRAIHGPKFLSRSDKLNTNGTS